ncbi:MAG: tRNA (cytidine(34)-2'-O)-methyltransferase [Bdellovibrionales bacterium]|nr:tRNA (cytidine(34)-2'-O)-methyltransferase [Bdellovibrionales bacterium]
MKTNHKYPKVNFRVVLVEPEIPNNTGNIGRTCVGTWSELHLVKPLGFEISDKQLRRAGLDYWPDLEVFEHDNFDSWLGQVEDFNRVFFFTTKVDNSLYDVEFQPGDWLVFGKETKGLGPAIIEKYTKNCVTIPMPGPVRSFNLANSVAISVFEGLRQLRA